MNKNVCLIDDDSVNNFIISRMLNKISPEAKITCFNSGNSAIDYLKTADAPDYIFLDLNMPVMDGWNFLDTLDSLDIDANRKTKIFIITTSLFNNDYLRGSNHPRISEYFVKPLSSIKLRDAIK
ncbi:response regulator [Mucilaginibacter conchicola]|uniref:Response regulator n=1 Tax=Mucilaginibacter conchicola TaxID=2303333 RepID=A0A372NMB2_9SPHI|nr:response regulator [Mucilaginibacter conchicola]RFZ90089.1 response regulator [Mucilaginibacter conchicola]